MTVDRVRELPRLVRGQQVARIDGEWQRVPPKSNVGRRMLSLLARTVTALHARRIRQATERLVAGTEWIGNPWDLVFVSEVGTPLDASNVVHAYQRELERARLPRQRFHDARHSVATFWLALGIPARVVADMLGHSQQPDLERLYARGADPASRGADRLETMYAES